MNKLPKNSASTPQPDKLRVGQIIEVEIGNLNHEGFGTGIIDNKFRVLLSGVLPGELVRAKVTIAGRSQSNAQVIKILRHAPDRLLATPCDIAAKCEGCPLVQMKYPAQLLWKHDMVAAEIGRLPSLHDVLLHPVSPSPNPLNYRNSAKLVIAGKFAAPQIGIYRRNSHEVLDIGTCPLHHPLINRVVEAVRKGIQKGKVPIYNPKSQMGLLRYLVIRVAESENRAMVVFVTSQRNYNEIHHLAKFLQTTVPEVVVVAQNVNPSTGNVILGERDAFLTKAQSLLTSIGQTKFSLSPRSFFQVNSGSARIIYEKVREWSALTGKETVIDLYCGIGGISLFLAATAHEVIGIEVVETAVVDAEQNARLNGVKNCTFEAGDAAELLEELREERKKIDLIVLNPPRKGCDELVLKRAAAIAPQKMIYVSCSPQTLARDLHILAGLGYKTLEIQPVDMFPQTAHVENVALIMKG